MVGDRHDLVTMWVKTQGRRGSNRCQEGQQSQEGCHLVNDLQGQEVGGGT